MQGTLGFGRQRATIVFSTFQTLSTASNAAWKSEHLQAACSEPSSAAPTAEGPGAALGVDTGRFCPRGTASPPPSLLLTAKAGEGWLPRHLGGLANAPPGGRAGFEDCLPVQGARCSAWKGQWLV